MRIERYRLSLGLKKFKINRNLSFYYQNLYIAVIS